MAHDPMNPFRLPADASPPASAPVIPCPDDLPAPGLSAAPAATGEEQPAAPAEPLPATPSAGAPAESLAGCSPAPADAPPAPQALPAVQVYALDWQAIRQAVDPLALRARMRAIVEGMEILLDGAGGPGMLFDSDRAHPDDRAIRVASFEAAAPLWIIGDLHGDLLALEAALAQIRAHGLAGNHPAPRIIFLGDFFDDQGMGLELLLRVFELIVQAPQQVCVVAGNHDEALSFDGTRFTSSVSPGDFADFLNAHRSHEWIERAGKLAVRLAARTPRALFFPDGLLVSHGGFPLGDLHAQLLETGDWNDPACLSDFVWTRAHPKARRKMPNRFSRGSQFGYEDFGDFCALSERLGRPVTHLVRGHDHVQERYAIFPAYQAHPVLTTVALSRRLHREPFGPYERAPTLALVVEGGLPQVYQLNIPAALINEVFPQPPASETPAAAEAAP
jgi:hypothetical protein